MTAVLMARVKAYGGSEAIAELLASAHSRRAPAYLSDIVNWISYDEAVALWQAGARVTRHPQFARAVGEDAARRLNGSPIAALFRSLGSPENVYRQIASTSAKYSIVTRLEAADVGPGFAEIIATPVDGFARDPNHCAWTCGLLTQPTVLFGLAPASVEHDECASLGAPHCRYRVTWVTEDAVESIESTRTAGLQAQLDAMKERLHSVFATASDLIGSDDITDVLARITDRAAVEIRAPRYLLAVHTTEDGPVLCHHRGFDGGDASGYAARLLGEHPAALPDSWLVVPVRSSRREYGRLLALYEDGRQFFAEERELLEVYARYAASALDSATALEEAKRRYGQSSALLELARALASAGTSGEVAHRLADALPVVVDCDRAAVHLWEPDRGQLVQSASIGSGPAVPDAFPPSRSPIPGGPLEQLLHNPRPEPIFIDTAAEHPILRELSASIGAEALILVPLTTGESFLGLIAVAVMDQPERLRSTPDLLDRLSGLAAQATTALQNGRLVDQITHQAMHDELTGLANRLRFNQELRDAVLGARQSGEPVTLFYLDLDGFKPVNDRFGHDTGDRLLVAAAQRLRTCTRAQDTVARLGGDEFAVLLAAGAADREADIVAGRLRNAFTLPCEIDGEMITVGASVGRAVFPRDAESAEQLMRVADAAMFTTKRSLRTPERGLAATDLVG